MFGLYKLLKNDNSKNLAKKRLQSVLLHDRSNISQNFLETLKEEVLSVIKKYIEIKDDDLKIKLKRVKTEDGESIMPYLDIPIKNAKVQ